MITKESKAGQEMLWGGRGAGWVHVQGRCSGDKITEKEVVGVIPPALLSRAASYFKPVGKRKSLHYLSLRGTLFSSLLWKTTPSSACLWVPFSWSVTGRLKVRKKDGRGWCRFCLFCSHSPSSGNSPVIVCGSIFPHSQSTRSVRLTLTRPRAPTVSKWSPWL